MQVSRLQFSINADVEFIAMLVGNAIVRATKQSKNSEQEIGRILRGTQTNPSCGRCTH